LGYFYALLDPEARGGYAEAMKFQKFKILIEKDHEAAGEAIETLYLNEDHIVSIKPINIVVEGEVVDGFWIRTTNGKKYRAVGVPQSYEKFLERQSSED